MLWTKAKTNPQSSQKKSLPALSRFKSEENYIFNFLAEEKDNNIVKYSCLTLNKRELNWNDFINLLKEKDKNFFKLFQKILKEANYKFSAYFWKCLPISKNTLDKPFEFVIIKSEALNNVTQDYKSFSQHLMLDAFVNEKYFASFSSSSKDSVLIIPALEFGRKTAPYSNDCKNISKFTENAPDEQQQEVWAEVANKLSEELEKNPDTPRWLNTHGLGVHYLHVRIDEKPKYYSDYQDYKKWN